jgi:hypothetical protein
MMIALQKTLFDSMTNSLLLRNRRSETLIQRFRGPRFQRSVHFGLFLAPGYFERLVVEKEGFGGGAQVRYSRFEIEDVLG